MRKLNVAVLMGGKTAEHEISIASGKQVLLNLDKEKYNVKPIIISKDGKWLIPNGYLKEIDMKSSDDGLVSLPQEIMKNLIPYSAGMALDRSVEEKVDVVFIAMHGPHGEDGTIQGLLELLDIPYTGSGVLASAIAMNKVKTLEVLKTGGILVPRYVVCNEFDWKTYPEDEIKQIEKKMGYPCVVKPVSLGSSVGISIVNIPEELKDGIVKAFEYDNEILIEEYLAGIEITCGVLGSGIRRVEALPPTKIIPKSGKFFDYDAKYTKGASDEITPAPIGENLTKKVQEVAVSVHLALRCSGMSRTDMIIKDDEKIYVLEVNTIPGLTELSLLPQEAKACGISFSALLDRLIEDAIEVHSMKKRKFDRDV